MELASLPPVPDLMAVAADALPAWRWLAGALAVVLGLGAARLPDRGAHVAVLLGAVILGHLAVRVGGAPEGPGKPWVDAGTVALLAAGALYVADRSARLALVVPGAVVGAFVAAGGLGHAPWEPALAWAVVAGAAALWPFLYEPFVLACAPAAAVIGGAWALGRPAVGVMLALWLVGLVAQLFRDPSAREGGHGGEARAG